MIRPHAVRLRLPLTAALLLAAAPAFAQEVGARAEYIARLTAERGQPAAPLATAPQASRTLAASAVRGARSLSQAPQMRRQTRSVATSCFPASLRGVLADLQAHFGGQVIVTSGYRSPGRNRRAGGARKSFHIHCMAADVQIAGVSPAAIARFARSHAAVGGVGTYRHTRSVHIDVGARVASWGGRGRNA